MNFSKHDWEFSLKKVVSKAKRYCAARNLPVKNEPLSPGMPATEKSREEVGWF